MQRKKLKGGKIERGEKAKFGVQKEKGKRL